MKHLNTSTIAGENPDNEKVVKKVLTDKSAFNIKGLHSAFKIPANRDFEYCALESNRLNTVMMQPKKLKLTFIDEISMVKAGSFMFNFLNLRLKQIMETKEPFGGISLLTVGDFFSAKTSIFLLVDL